MVRVGMDCAVGQVSADGCQHWTAGRFGETAVWVASGGRGFLLPRGDRGTDHTGRLKSVDDEDAVSPGCGSAARNLPKFRIYGIFSL
jgi:hypothetical protein